jgi:hypothetical protein
MGEFHERCPVIPNQIRAIRVSKVFDTETILLCEQVVKRDFTRDYQAVDFPLVL